MKDLIIRTAIKNSGIILNTDTSITRKLFGPWFYFSASACYTNPDTAPTTRYIHPMFENDVITLNNYVMDEYDDARSLSIFFHELVHATGRGNRLNREGCSVPNGGDLSTDVYAFEELVAESGAMLLMSLFKQNTKQTDAVSKKYIASYLEDMTVVKSRQSPFDEGLTMISGSPAGKSILAKAELQAREAVSYILKNWLVDIAEEAKKDAA